MDVFVTGSTGVLGSRLVSLLADRGHDVAGLVRGDEGAARVEAAAELRPQGTSSSRRR
jgi:nucleoside-diphosphate-sugar epimerase